MSDRLPLHFPAPSPKIRASSIRNRTVKICLDENIAQEPTRCECPHDHNDTVCHDAGASIHLRPRTGRPAAGGMLGLYFH